MGRMLPQPYQGSSRQLLGDAQIQVPRPPALRPLQVPQQPAIQPQWASGPRVTMQAEANPASVHSALMAALGAPSPQPTASPTPMTFPSQANNPARSSLVGFGNLARKQAAPAIRPLGPAPAVDPTEVLAQMYERQGNLTMAWAIRSDRSRGAPAEQREAEMHQAHLAGMGADTEGKRLTNQGILPMQGLRLPTWEPRRP